MLPFLTSRGTTSAGVVSPHFPPPRFKPLTFPISEVRLSANPYRVAKGTSEAQVMGLRYEAHVQNFLGGIFPGYLAGSYIHFCDGINYRTVQPDGILVFDDRVFIIEIKYQHVPEAWWQLAQLYSPVVQHLWPHKKVSLVEVCRSYDPSTPFPGPITLIEDIREWVSRDRKEFGVLIWRK